MVKGEKNVFERAKKKQVEKIKTSLLISKKTYDEFSKICTDQGVSISRVLEQLMEEAIETGKKRG